MKNFWALALLSTLVSCFGGNSSSSKSSPPTLVLPPDIVVEELRCSDSNAANNGSLTEDCICPSDYILSLDGGSCSSLGIQSPGSVSLTLGTQIVTRGAGSLNFAIQVRDAANNLITLDQSKVFWNLPKEMFKYESSLYYPVVGVYNVSVTYEGVQSNVIELTVENDPNEISNPTPINLYIPQNFPMGKNYNLNIGTTKEFSVAMQNSDYRYISSDNLVVWTSSDSSIASVDEFGNVTAKAEGSAVITASYVEDNSIQDSTTIHVAGSAAVLAQQFSAKQEVQLVLAGVSGAKKVKLARLNENFGLSTEVEGNFSFESMDASLVEVDGQGVVSVNPDNTTGGIALVKANLNKENGQVVSILYMVRVYDSEPEIQSTAFSASSVNAGMMYGTVVFPILQSVDQLGKKVTVSGFTYSSSNTSSATVDPQTGVVTIVNGFSSSTAIITATSNVNSEISMSYTINVVGFMFFNF